MPSWLSVIKKVRQIIQRLSNIVLYRISPLFSKSGFFLQGQMDIHPLSFWHNASLCSETGGFWPREKKEKREIVNIEPWDHVRRDMIILLLRSIIERNIQGDLAELGVWKGYTAKLIHHYVPERHFYLFDTFSGFDKRDIVAENKHTGHKIDKRDFSDTTKQNVLRYIHPVNENVFCLAGYFPESIPSHLFNKSYSLRVNSIS